MKFKWIEFVPSNLKKCIRTDLLFPIMPLMCLHKKKWKSPFRRNKIQSQTFCPFIMKIIIDSNTANILVVENLRKVLDDFQKGHVFTRNVVIPFSLFPSLTIFISQIYLPDWSFTCRSIFLCKNLFHAWNIIIWSAFIRPSIHP